MPWKVPQPQYATKAQFRDYAKQEDLDPDQDANIDLNLKAASSTVDRKTATWWNQRTVTLTITVRKVERNVYLPAPIITLTSVKEDGLALVEITSPGATGTFYAFERYIQKSDAFLWPQNRSTRRDTWWSPIPNAIEIVADLGFPTANGVPEEIVILTCGIAAYIADMRVRATQSPDGSIVEVPISKYPRWIEQKFEDLKFVSNFSRQKMKTVFA